MLGPLSVVILVDPGVDVLFLAGLLSLFVSAGSTLSALAMLLASLVVRTSVPASVGGIVVATRCLGTIPALVAATTSATASEGATPSSGRGIASLGLLYYFSLLLVLGLLLLACHIK